MNKNYRPHDKSRSLPKGWVKISDSEAAKIWGKGNAGSANPQKTMQTPNQCMDNNCSLPNCKGMPCARAWGAQADNAINLNRLLPTTYPDSTKSINTYKNLDRIFTTDRLGRTTQFDYNSLDQLVATTDNLGRKTQYKWCNCGSLASVTDANGNVTKWHHDIEGRLITKTYCDGTTDNYTYEANNSRLSTLTDPESQVTVQANDTLSSIARGIANAINASSALSAIGITSSSNVNVTFTGQDFNTNLLIAADSTSITITGTDAANNQVSNNVAISSIGQNNANTSFDLNGDMTSDGTNTYQYDAEDRLVQINYPGTGNNTQIFYDGLGHWVKSIETTNNATTSVIQYLWSGDNLIEERDQNGNVLRRFFSLGEQINGTSYYYVKDHLGSIRQMTDSSGNVVYQADYDAYGQSTVSINTATPAFGYAGYFVHGRSGLNLTVHRAYSPTLARFLNRDPIGESGGINLYGYVGGETIDLSDQSGLSPNSSNSCKNKKSPKNGRPLVIPFMWNSSPSYPTINDIPFGVPGAETLDGYPLAPPGVSLEENGRLARSNFLNFPWFISQVSSEQPWDYKNTVNFHYANFGNFNFGYTSAAIGLPLDIALRGGGAYQEFFQTQNYSPTFGHFYLTPPYGDDPMDEDYIVRGWHYFYEHGLK